MKLSILFFALLLLVCATAISQVKPTKILINNVEIFNGKDRKTIKGNVLIENNIITKISADDIITNR